MTRNKINIEVETHCHSVISNHATSTVSEHIDVIKGRAIPTILTPHPLEFSRITGYSVEKIQENRLELCAEFAKNYSCVLVLKGADTVVGHPDGSISICSQSNSGLAKAGSGDVLAGIISALLAQGVAPETAADLGVYLHSRAGMLARKSLGAYGMTASDVIHALPYAIKEMSQEQE